MSKSKTILSSNHEIAIIHRLERIEKCLRNGSFIFFGTDKNDLFISSNIFQEQPENLTEAVWDGLRDAETMKLFKSYVTYLNTMLTNHPLYEPNLENLEEGGVRYDT